MAAQPVQQLALPHAAPMAVAVFAEKTVTARRVATLLAAAGVAMEEAADAIGRPERRRLVLVAPACEASERVDRIDRAAAQHPAMTVVATMPDDAGTSVLRRALRAGAGGIVLDGELDRTLIATLRAVWAGQLVVPPRLGRKIARRHLSHREKQILSLVAIGYTNHQIADRLVLAESTIKTHLSSAFAKLDARSRAEAAAMILDPEEGYGVSMAPVFAELSLFAAVPGSGRRAEDRPAAERSITMEPIEREMEKL